MTEKEMIEETLKYKADAHNMLFAICKKYPSIMSDAFYGDDELKNILEDYIGMVYMKENMPKTLYEYPEDFEQHIGMYFTKKIRGTK